MDAWLDIKVAFCTSDWIYINWKVRGYLKVASIMLWPWKFDFKMSVFLVCMASSSVTDRMPLQTPEYKVSLFCQNMYTLMISFDDGIMSNWLTSCKEYKRSELYRSLKHSLTSKHDQEHICQIWYHDWMQLDYLYSSASERLKEICPRDK
jgi:hypothetical protein